MSSDLLHQPVAPGLEPILIDYRTAAALLGVSERTLRTWSDVPKFEKGGRVLFSPVALRQWVAQQIQRPAAAPVEGEDAK
ncbi:MAG TPA: helix-turn-helix domain-containing protein [Tepidisphaeraceae bacterium]|jgi:hypothetical protein